jgi:hypothetical protein
MMLGEDMVVGEDILIDKLLGALGDGMAKNKARRRRRKTLSWTFARPS